MSFNLQNHHLHGEAILEPLVKEFENIPLLPIDSIPKFPGAGVYALHMVDTSATPYDGYIRKEKPIYVGKAVPSGWRQGRNTDDVGNVLINRIMQHYKNLETVNLGGYRFEVRFAVLSGAGLDLISSLESALIRKYRPLWNSYIDGFGNHDPGRGRYAQSPSEWDTLHPGRHWAERLTGKKPEIEKIIDKIRLYK
ncbi:Eco29kI family restriction endonuclease [Salinivibrio kushneri]|uniref:Eco29kI family restriction endonuclease n=1 Tax=Salinivibrio kushneri TaxID=1908198 RepID=UPI0009892D48|nr:Eco29kI family restriction endonuclease [Salinivibrio kushneri]OOE64080.1 hypothetical protein BZG19_15310 [Salinivibrio kushneri]